MVSITLSPLLETNKRVKKLALGLHGALFCKPDTQKRNGCHFRAPQLEFYKLFPHLVYHIAVNLLVTMQLYKLDYLLHHLWPGTLYQGFCGMGKKEPDTVTSTFQGSKYFQGLKGST